jgi:hypothetical protein
MRILKHKIIITGLSLFMALSAVLLSLSSVASQEARTVSIASTVVAEPQTKCEKGFLHVQFEGQAEWFQTTKRCDMRAAPPKLDTSQASKRLTQAQLDALLESYLSGNPQPQDQQVCCCNWKVYDNSTHKCSWGKLIPKYTQ